MLRKRLARSRNIIESSIAVLKDKRQDPSEQLLSSKLRSPTAKVVSASKQCPLEWSYSQCDIPQSSSSQGEGGSSSGKQHRKRRILRKLHAAISRSVDVGTVDAHKEPYEEFHKLSKRLSLDSGLTYPSSTGYTDLVRESTYDSDAKHISTPRIYDESTLLIPEIAVTSRPPSLSRERRRTMSGSKACIDLDLLFSLSLEALDDSNTSHHSLGDMAVKASPEHVRAIRDGSLANERVLGNPASRVFSGQYVPSNNRPLGTHVNPMPRHPIPSFLQQRSYSLNIPKKRGFCELRVSSPQRRPVATLRTSLRDVRYTGLESCTENKVPLKTRFTEIFDEEGQGPQGKAKERRGPVSASIPCQQIRNVSPRIGYNYRFVDALEALSHVPKAISPQTSAKREMRSPAIDTRRKAFKRLDNFRTVRS